MKRILIVILTLWLLALCACGAPAGDVPAATPTPAATEAPEPEATPVPEEPGAGRLLIHVKQSDGTAVPAVTVTGREAAAGAINAALAGETHALYQIARGDSRVLSLIRGDALPGEEGLKVWGAVSFDTLTGETLTFADLSPYPTTLGSICGDYLYQSGIAGDVPGYLTDGHWYLSGEGLAFLTENSFAPQPIVVPYGALIGVLYDEWMPPEQDPVSGTLAAAYTTDTDVSGKELLDELTVSGGFESVLLWAQGDIRSLRAALVETPDGAVFTETELLWYASALEDGEAVRLNVTVPEGIPHLKLSWQTDTGVYEALLGRDGRTGGVQLVSLSGEALAAADSPYAHITREALIGYWSNDAQGAEGQSLSIASPSVCYLWHNGLGYDGDGFLWELVYRDGDGLCPQIIVHAAGGDLIYAVETLDGDTLDTDAGTFTRAQAVG